MLDLCAKFLKSYLSYGLLHRIGETRNLVSCFPLQMRDPGGQLAMGRLQVLDQLPLVLVHLLLEPLDERGAVARVSSTHRPLKKIFTKVSLI